MNILFLAAEAAPLAVNGGLGQAVGALAQALADLGHDVRVAIPFSGVIDRARFAPQFRVAARFTVPHIGGDQVARVTEVRHGGVTFYLIAGPPIPRAKRIYGAGIHEDGPKFIFTALAALGLCRALAWTPDVVHGYGSLAGPAMYWLGTDGLHDLLFQDTASVLTIRSLDDMASGAGRYLLDYGLTPSDSPLLPDWARASLLGLGLAHADVLNTLSPAYARAILTAEQGHGLEGLFQARRARLSGVLNGLDLDTWDPRRDPHLDARYDAGRLDRRHANKRALQKAWGLPREPRTALIGVVLGRDAHNGSDIGVSALRELLASPAGVQVVVLSAGLRASEAEFRALAAEHPGRVRLHLGLAAALTSQVYAGIDLLLVLDYGETCRSAHMIALRHGAVPVVYAADGLADTIIDYAQTRRGTGFVYTDYNAQSMLSALRRVLDVYRKPARWRALQRRGMHQALQFSWAHSAENYLALYQQAINYRKEAVTTLTQRLADDPALDSSGSGGSRMAGAGQATPR